MWPRMKGKGGEETGGFVVEGRFFFSLFSFGGRGISVFVVLVFLCVFFREEDCMSRNGDFFESCLVTVFTIGLSQ